MSTKVSTRGPKKRKLKVRISEKNSVKNKDLRKQSLSKLVNDKIRLQGEEE